MLKKKRQSKYRSIAVFLALVAVMYLATLFYNGFSFVFPGYTFTWGKHSINVKKFDVEFTGFQKQLGFDTLQVDSIDSRISLEEEVGNEYGVSAAHPLAVEVGMEVLRKGGNAVDAAVAVSYALGVVEPYASGIGGGGAMLIYSPKGEAVVYDYREIYPFSGGSPKKGVGVPGFVKGMEEIHKEHGVLKLDLLLEPAIQIAAKGFTVGEKLNKRLNAARYRLPIKELTHLYPASRSLRPGDSLEQQELARTLQLIKTGGATAFYKGPLAEEIIKAVPGLSLGDFSDYSVRKTKPVAGEFNGYQVLSAPPPLGGVTLIQALQMAEALKIEKVESYSVDFIHLTGEINKRAYRDRLVQVADPNFVNVPTEGLLKKDYTTKLASEIQLDKLSEIYTLDSSIAEEEDHSNTTHFVVVDQAGMMVSVTNTLSNFFGSGIYTKGFFLNNQLENFSTDPISINRPAPGKRPRSYISPTILVNEDEVLGIGSPGGRRIPAMLSQILIKAIKTGRDLQEAIEEPRFFIEDNKVIMEGKVQPVIRNSLSKRGYQVLSNYSDEYFGALQALVLNKKEGVVSGAADHRREGTWKSERPEY